MGCAKLAMVAAWAVACATFANAAPYVHRISTNELSEAKSFRDAESYKLAYGNYSTETPKSFNISMRTLILSTDPLATELPETMLNAYAHPYEIIELAIDDTSANVNMSFLDNLVDSDGNPRYNSIVVTSSSLGVPLENGTWSSVLTTDDWMRLRAYCAKFQVRFVSLASSYVVDESVTPAPGLEQGMTGSAYLTFADNEFTQKHLGLVKKDAVFKIGQVNEFVSTSYWWTPAFVASNASHITPFLYINPAEPFMNPACNATISSEDKAVESAPASIVGGTEATTVNCSDIDAENMIDHPNWVGAFIRNVDGREEMHFLVNSNMFGHHGFVLGNVWVDWMLRGLFIGQRRLHLDTEIDDALLSTRVYNVAADRSASEVDPAYRASTSDYMQLHQYTLDLNKRLANGSRYVPQLAYNGIGWFDNEYNIDDVNEHMFDIRDHFFWVSHTWSHMDLYCPDSNCEKNGKTKYNDSLFELEKNEWFAETVLFENVPTEMLTSWPTFSRHALVTPRISGLNLSDSVQAMIDTRIYNAVGDNSRKDLKPPNPYHTFPSAGRGSNNESIAVIPRSATRVYFDCSTAEEAAKEHNSIYGPKCFGYNRTGEVTYPWKCNRTSFKYSRDLTYDEMMLIEGFEMVRGILAWRQDPFMMHQANFRFFDHHGRNASLLTLWIDNVVEYIHNYTSAPVMTHKLDYLKELFFEREARDACGIEGKIEMVDGKPVAIDMYSEKECTAKLSRSLQPDGTDPWQISSSGVEEIYGSDRTRDVPLKGETSVRLELGEAKDVTFRPPYTYPLINETHMEQLSSYQEVMSVKRFELYIVGNVTEQTNYLRDLLAAEMAPVVEMHGPIGLITCHDDGEEDKKNDAMIQEVENRYHYLSMPAEDARRLNKTWPADMNRSWYLQIEESMQNVSDSLKADARETIAEEAETASRSTDAHVNQSVDRLENFGTTFFAKRYQVFIQLKKRYNELPKCSAGQADPIDPKYVTTFSDGSNLAAAGLVDDVSSLLYFGGDSSGDS